MPAIQYSQLGKHKKVNEIVMAGSHDAAITSGGIRAQTQERSIHAQAYRGVRIFDIRISGQRTGLSGAKLSAFHGKNTPKAVTKNVGGAQTNIQLTRMVLGDWGMDLDDILTSANTFVTSYPDEFLILKFDKSSNYELILKSCQAKLGGALYTKAGNLADHTLSDMAGKVVCGFMPDGFAELQHAGYGIADGAAQIVNLYPNKGAPNAIDGLMYYGKGGTSLVQPKKYALSAPIKGKFLQNIDKQRQILADANAQNFSRDVLRMMYWTQTGMVRSIKERDKKAWTDGSKDRLKTLWAEGGYDYMWRNVPRAFGLESHSTNFKYYLPNFIMIDFANKDKGETIYDLNLLTTAEIVQLNGTLAYTG
jgi:hypothetical protein